MHLVQRLVIMARIKFNFWLDKNKDDELLVAERIDELKKRRGFASVLRDGIMIVSELREGRVDLLLKLYPWVVDVIRSSVATQSVADDELRRQIADLKLMMLERGTIASIPSHYSLMQPNIAPPVLTAKTAPGVDASTIADDFLAFIQ